MSLASFPHMMRETASTVPEQDARLSKADVPPPALRSKRTDQEWAPGFPVTALTISEFMRKRRELAKVLEREVASLNPFHVTVRQRGGRIFSSWFDAVPFYRTLNTVIDEFPAAHTVEICAVDAIEAVAPERWATVLTRRNCGRLGLELRVSGITYRVAPTETIATNLSLERWMERILEERGLERAGLAACGGQLSILKGRQFLARLGEHPTTDELYRGNTVLMPQSATPELMESVIDGMGQWFMANIGEDGSIPYKYWPSAGTLSSADNPIRRFMATIALNRLGIARNDGAMLRAAHKNLAYNLARFYREEGLFGQIYWDGSVKLGAIALAALAILESEARNSWTVHYERLGRSIDALWRPNGAFRTFMVPASRNDNQNFYPGETLLLWASQLGRKMDPSLLARALLSVDYYKAHFREDPNPAFVPWHSQALSLLYKLTGRQDLRDFVFEMNDWLVPHQQWGGDLDPDLWGRFYSPGRPDYGPPHAASTGAYMEGFADAFRLAVESSDRGRAETYSRVIYRALRSIAQLQFDGKTDAFYVTKLPRVLGGVRTEVYDNEIRVDNIQHALMGLLKFRGVPGHTGTASSDTQGDVHD